MNISLQQHPVDGSLIRPLRKFVERLQSENFSVLLKADDHVDIGDLQSPESGLFEVNNVCRGTHQFRSGGD